MNGIIQHILAEFPMYLNALVEIVGALVILATIITKLTPSPKDDEALEGFKLKWHAFLAWLPTFGYNKHQDVVVDSKEDKSA